MVSAGVLVVLLQAATVASMGIPQRFLDIFPRGGSSNGEDAPSPSGGQSLNLLASRDRMPSMFAPQESHYDRYAACLAATEGLRRIRDKALVKEGRNRPKKDELTERQSRIHAEYVMNSGKVLKAMGMSITQFNQLGREVMEQAYLYRMAATMDMDRMPLIEDPASEKLLKANRRQRVQMFCESMQEIEQLRSDQMTKLKKSLHVRQLPKGISLSDPTVLPLLAPRVRAVVEAFPLQAEEIVKKHGLHSDEFNKMMEEAKSSPVFRWKVEKYMKQSQASKR